MAFDFGYLIAGLLILYIVGISYKKKTGQNLSELWKGGKEKIKDLPDKGYQRVYITRGIKQ